MTKSKKPKPVVFLAYHVEGCDGKCEWFPKEVLSPYRAPEPNCVIESRITWARENSKLQKQRNFELTLGQMRQRQ